MNCGSELLKASVAPSSPVFLTVAGCSTLLADLRAAEVERLAGTFTFGSGMRIFTCGNFTATGGVAVYATFGALSEAP